MRITVKTYQKKNQDLKIKIFKNLFSDNAPTLTPRDHYLRTTRYLPGTVTRIQPQNNNNNNGAQSPLNIPIQGSRRQNSLKSSKFMKNMFVYLERWRKVSVTIIDRKIDFVKNWIFLLNFFVNFLKTGPLLWEKFCSWRKSFFIVYEMNFDWTTN